MLTYSHCKHCAWSNPHHVAEHATPCGSWCSESRPVDNEPDLFDLLAAIA